MRKIYTDDLIRFIYHETTAAESNAISLALQSDPQLSAEYTQLAETLGQLDSISLSPDPTSIAIIMEKAGRKELAH